MGIIQGTHGSGNKTEILELDCPNCGDIIEVFVKGGSTLGEGVCEVCGYKIPAGTVIEE